MSLRDLFDIFSRLASAPDRIDREYAHVLQFLRKYFDAMYAIERCCEGANFRAADPGHDALIDAKKKVHREFWCNLSEFYDPIGLSSLPDHDWRRVMATRVMRTGDDDEPRFMVLYAYEDPNSEQPDLLGIVIRSIDGHLKIEHQYH